MTNIKSIYIHLLPKLGGGYLDCKCLIIPKQTFETQ
jgi:hypothetical protein